MNAYIKGPYLQKFSPKIAEVEIGHESSPSWQQGGRGFASLRATRHIVAEWVSLVVIESPQDGRNRQVMLTLTKDEAWALGLFLTRMNPETFPVQESF